jgi:beta-galactosidase/beta-glucuronidase
MARWYYHCDRLGLIVWQDMPSGGKGLKPVRNLLVPLLFPGRVVNDKRYRAAGRAERANREEFRRELQEMVNSLFNHPSIGMWVIFNEGWGQFEAREFHDWLLAYDPSRYIDHASGWFDQGAGLVKSVHTYLRRLEVPADVGDRVYIISEYGGYALPLTGHLWREGRQSGQKSFKTKAALNQALHELFNEQLKPLIAKGLSGAVYTQLSDVEAEVNGLVTYDREIIKAEPGVFI